MKKEWQRYSCQLALPGFDERMQQKLTDARVLIVGAGGLGCPLAQYLVASGIGTITLADFDEVSVSNLHRQILYNEGDIGKLKSEVACERLRKQNPLCNLKSFTERINPDNVLELVSEHDVVVDCTDNIETKYLLNDACVMNEKPLVYGAIYQFDGQVSVFNVAKSGSTRSANYRHLFPEVNASALTDCAEGGVLPTIAGIIGCMQANEVLKLLTGIGELLTDRLLIYDGRDATSRVIRINQSANVQIDSLVKESKSRSITWNELSALTNANKVLLVDVREEWERSEFNIGGIHVPLNELHELKIDGDSTVVVYCQSGRRSAFAAQLLQEKYPWSDIRSLEGGIKDKQPAEL